MSICIRLETLLLLSVLFKSSMTIISSNSTSYSNKCYRYRNLL